MIKLFLKIKFLSIIFTLFNFNLSAFSQSPYKVAFESLSNSEILLSPRYAFFSRHPYGVHPWYQTRFYNSSDAYTPYFDNFNSVSLPVHSPSLNRFNNVRDIINYATNLYDKNIITVSNCRLFFRFRFLAMRSGVLSNSHFEPWVGDITSNFLEQNFYARLNYNRTTKQVTFNNFRTADSWLNNNPVFPYPLNNPLDFVSTASISGLNYSVVNSSPNIVNNLLGSPTSSVFFLPYFENISSWARTREAVYIPGYPFGYFQERWHQWSPNIPLDITYKVHQLNLLVTYIFVGSGCVNIPPPEPENTCPTEYNINVDSRNIPKNRRLRYKLNVNCSN